MSNFFNEFPSTSKAEWKDKLINDLKGKDPSLLEINDQIEDLKISSYLHREDALNLEETPGNFPFTRGLNKDDNNWKNGFFILISDEKEANKKALNALNSGADLLVLKSEKESTNWSLVLEGVQIEYIDIHFVITKDADYSDLKALNLPVASNVRFHIDFLDGKSLDDLSTTAQDYTSQQQRFCAVNGFKVQQLGANTWQEVSFCLSVGHEYLVALMNAGLNVDEAAACISFNVGVGSNYFNEVAKFRALRKNWAKIIDAYSPEHNCSYNCSITAVIGHLNKSLKDPHTNLLRQTTETMSALSGGAEGIVILPYDLNAEEGSSELAERMAINISNILKEESYFDKVIDPLGGSYTVEQLTELIGKKSWERFQEIDSQGGMFDKAVVEKLKNQIEEKRSLRIEAFQSGKKTAIGMNKFENPEAKEVRWKTPSNYLGLRPLILENETIAV